VTGEEKDFSPHGQRIPEDLVLWDWESTVLVVAADRSFGSVLTRMFLAKCVWVVVVWTSGAQTLRYAYLGEELRQRAKASPGRLEQTLANVLDLHKLASSATSRRGRVSLEPQQEKGPAAARIIDLDPVGRITGIGQLQNLAVAAKNVDELGSSRAASPASLDLGPMRSGTRTEVPSHVQASTARPSVPAPIPPDTIKVMLSSEVATEIQVSSDTTVSFRIEMSLDATPLAVSLTSEAKTDQPIVVSLSTETDTISIAGEQALTVLPPTHQQPRTGAFQIRGNRAGASRLAVMFRQGGSDLGTIGLVVEVVEAFAKPRMTRGVSFAAPRDADDDDKLALLVEQRIEGGAVTYQFILHSETLDLPYRKFASKPLLDRGGGPAATALAFVDRVYECVTQELKSRDDLRKLQREARALGAKLSKELFDPDVARVLWPLRDRIKLIQIVSWEPLIPWELVRLQNPDTDEIDDRFLGEYSLVRTLSDEPPARQLPMNKWRFFGAAYPMSSMPEVGGERDYFTGTSTKSLNARSIKSAVIPPSRDALYDVLAEGDFDVLHISCHADAAHASIDRASLIIGDALTPGDSEPHNIEVDTVTVEAEARLRRNRPLIFLNACETGRIGAVLTSLGGWPNVFLRAGAGAFIGATWAVRDKPATVFATAFYEALLDGKTLAEAARDARISAKALGDTSWLAFKVYGHPLARRPNP
jgi:hypothetical protein